MNFCIYNNLIYDEWIYIEREKSLIIKINRNKQNLKLDGIKYVSRGSYMFIKKNKNKQPHINGPRELLQYILNKVLKTHILKQKKFFFVTQRPHWIHNYTRLLWFSFTLISTNHLLLFIYFYWGFSSKCFFFFFSAI